MRCFWLGRSLDNRQTLVLDFRFQLGGPVWFRFWLGFQCDRVGPVLSQFMVVMWTPSLRGHPSFYPVAHITEHPTMHTFDFAVKMNLCDDV